ncbi:MAG: beta-ketoacyl-ACP synthase I [Bdellovibrionaceae bacterium]|nr:beta-ketoacyl-ACP synthase I [Pseudobdellovibrionaceae bacterium]
MRRVVVTGIGIISPIGNGKKDVTESLKAMKSGVVKSETYAQMGMRSQIHAPIHVDWENLIDRKLRRFMGPGIAYGYLAAKEAIEDAGLTPEMISNPRTGVIVGSGGPSTSNLVEAWDTARQQSVKKIGPFAVPKAMSSGISANLATAFEIKGYNYSISSACSTSAHCIGNAAEIIQLGKQDIMIAGGSEEEHWTMSSLFDAMGAMSSKYNDAPATASRPFDRTRDGFVISGGGGMVILEEYEHAKKRGATIYAELAGYGATSDGYDMVAPSGEGAIRCMKMAIATATKPVQYLNAHGTATPVGDIQELKAIREVFGRELPFVSSTKSMTGHALGAAGANEAIYTLLMMKEGFLTGTLNLNDPEDEVKDMPLLRQTEQKRIEAALSNSFGFGGTNCSLVFQTI